MKLDTQDHKSSVLNLRHEKNHSNIFKEKTLTEHWIELKRYTQIALYMLEQVANE